MTQKTRAELKAYFETGDTPTEAEFVDLIESIINILDDGNFDPEGSADTAETNAKSYADGLASNYAPALGEDDNYVTDAEKTLLSNTSGSNSGDNATNTQYSGLEASKQDALGFTPEDVAEKSTNVTTDGASDTKYPSVKAVKDYADQLIGAANAVVYKGAVDCSTNPNYPSADAGNIYIVSVAGKIGGASGIEVEVGDMYICTTDSTASGDQASVGAYWNVIQKNIADYIIGPSSVTDATIPLFDGVTGKLLKGSAYTPASFAPALGGDDNYVTDAEKTILGNTSGANSGDETATRIGALIGGAGDATPNNTDFVATSLTAGGILKKITWTNVKAFLKTYFDTLYKGIEERVGTTTSSATPTINTDNYDEYYLTAQAEDITSMTTNLSGTPVIGDTLWISITGTAARAIDWGTGFENGAVDLPTTTVGTERLDAAFKWNAVTSKWRCMAAG